jgi:hypothetical protein
MIDLNTGNSLQISKHIGATHTEVMEVMKHMESIMPHSFEGTKGYGDSIDVHIKYSALATVKDYMKGGGFSGQQQQQAAEAARQEYKDQLELKNLEAAIRTASSSKRIAWISLIISSIVALIEVIKLVQSIE